MPQQEGGGLGICNGIGGRSSLDPSFLVWKKLQVAVTMLRLESFRGEGFDWALSIRSAASLAKGVERGNLGC